MGARLRSCVAFVALFGFVQLASTREGSGALLYALVPPSVPQPLVLPGPPQPLGVSPGSLRAPAPLMRGMDVWERYGDRSLDCESAVDRRACIAAALGTAASVLLPASPAYADSKYGKEYEACLSQCIYQETKITKGIKDVKVVSKDEAMISCKAQCASKKKKKN